MTALAAAYAMALQMLFAAFVPVAPLLLASPFAVLCSHDEADGTGQPARHDLPCAALCAASPIPASSGKTNRHRLNPAGDRDANRALYLIILSRLRYCPDTKAYAKRRQAQCLSKRETIRCLKRYVARQI